LLSGLTAAVLDLQVLQGSIAWIRKHPSTGQYATSPTITVEPSFRDGLGPWCSAEKTMSRPPGTDMVCMAAIVCPVNSDSSSPRAAYSRGTLPIAHNYRFLVQACRWYIVDTDALIFDLQILGCTIAWVPKYLVAGCYRTGLLSFTARCFQNIQGPGCPAVKGFFWTAGTQLG